MYENMSNQFLWFLFIYIPGFYGYVGFLHLLETLKALKMFTFLVFSILKFEDSDIFNYSINIFQLTIKYTVRRKANGKI